jgi:hypothetical protein
VVGTLVMRGATSTNALSTLAPAGQSYPEGEQEHGECRRQYAEGLHTKLIEIACGGEHISKTGFRFLKPDAEV